MHSASADPIIDRDLNSGASSSPAPDIPAAEQPVPAVLPAQHRNSGVLQRLLVERPAEAQRLIARLHRNLGHLSHEQMVDQLRSRGASNAILKAAKGASLSYMCSACSPCPGSEKFTPQHFLVQPTPYGGHLVDYLACRPHCSCPLDARCCHKVYGGEASGK